MCGSKSEVGTFPPHSRPYGLGYADWSIRWWQRLYSITRENNPAIDDSGKNCSQIGARSSLVLGRDSRKFNSGQGV